MGDLVKQRYRVEGVAPILMHNLRLLDPLEPITKAISNLTRVRSKDRTDDWHHSISKMEWYGGLYHNGTEEVTETDVAVSESARVIIPSLMIEGVVVSGAKKTRSGPQAKAGVYADEDVLLGYEGPNNINKLWESRRFISRVGARNQSNKVMRTRPIFAAGWTAEFELVINTEICNEADVFKWLDLSGKLKGFGDWTPKHGRFEVSRV